MTKAELEVLNENSVLGVLQSMVDALKNPPRTLGIDDRLWDADTIADYLCVSRRYVIEHYACQPDFPAAIMLPTSSGVKAQRRWKPTEIRRWAERRQETKAKLN